jgi:hypothetical protein
MTTTIVNPAETIRALINTNWNTTNYNPKPKITKTGDTTQGREDLPMTDGSVRVYTMTTDEHIYSLGYSHTRVFSTVAVEVSIPRSESKFFGLVNEVRRILYAYCKVPGTGWDEAVIIRTNDQTSKHTGLFRMIFDIELRRWGEVV